jgi:hypothetical protein
MFLMRWINAEAMLDTLMKEKGQDILRETRTGRIMGFAQMIYVVLLYIKFSFQ